MRATLVGNLMPESQTDKNVSILGAGFSAGANARLLYNFLDKSRQLRTRLAAMKNGDLLIGDAS